MSYTQLTTEKGNHLGYIYYTDKSFTRRARCCECKELKNITFLLPSPSRHFCQECWSKAVTKLLIDMKQMVVVEAL